MVSSKETDELLYSRYFHIGYRWSQLSLRANRQSVIVITVFRWGKWINEIRKFLWGHKAGKWPSCDLHPGRSDSKAHACIRPPCRLCWQGRTKGRIFWRFALQVPGLGRWKEEINVCFLDLPIFTTFFGYHSLLYLRPSFCDHCSSE